MKRKPIYKSSSHDYEGSISVWSPTPLDVVANNGKGSYLAEAKSRLSLAGGRYRFIPSNDYMTAVAKFKKKR